MTQNSFTEIFPEVKKVFLNKWEKAAKASGIPKEAYEHQLRLVEDPSGNSKYNFCVMFNIYRSKYKRPAQSEGCPLCNAVNLVEKNPKRAVTNSPLPNSVIIPNIFPTMYGASLIISTQKQDNHVPIHNTSNLKGLEDKLSKLFKFGNETGWQIHYNTEGAGASIPWHDHSHLMNFGNFFNKINRIYGYENPDLNLKKVNNQVYKLENFPFFHLIFPEKEVGKISHFLKNLGKQMGSKFEQGFVPHWICQGKKGF